MDKRIMISCGEYKIVAKKGADTNYNEIFIWLEDKNGICIQDLAIVGQQYHYNDDLGVIQDDGIVVRVYADENNEDYTHQFHIGIYKEEE